MMVTAIGVLLVLLVLFGVFLFFARRILRLALKLAFVGAIVFSLFGGAMLGWWRGWFSPSSKETASQSSHPNARIPIDVVNKIAFVLAKRLRLGSRPSKLEFT
jgi:hypothetical protein